MRAALSFHLSALFAAALALPVLGCGPAPEPIPPPTAAPSPPPSAPPAAAATASATALATASAPPLPPPPPAAGKTRLAWILQGKDKSDLPLAVSIEVPAEWGVSKISGSATSLKPCAQQGIFSPRISVESCAGKGEAACLEAHTLPPAPNRTRIGQVEDLNPSRRFALARTARSRSIPRIEGSAAVYDAQTDQAAVCSFDSFEYEKAAQRAYSDVCRTLLARPAGVTPTELAEKPATPGGFPATNAADLPGAPAALELAAMVFKLSGSLRAIPMPSLDSLGR
jgi:hypothetical protein